MVGPRPHAWHSLVQNAKSGTPEPAVVRIPERL
jgi:hypothetical protein